MTSIPSSHTVSTARGRTRVFMTGDPAHQPVVFIHGNVSSARFFAETLASLPPRYHAIAPDMRGYGDAEALPLDATRGMRDFSDDLHALLTHFELGGPARKVHLVGWSLGGDVIMQYAMDHAENVKSLTLIAPGSPYGFGGTKGLEGTPTTADFAGSGGGTANPDFKKRLGDKDATDEAGTSPRQVMNQFYFKPPFRVDRAREDVLVEEMLKMAVGDANYPGDLTTSPHWPGIAPGTRGVNNALSPKYCNLSSFARIDPRPDVLWIRGADDQIVSDTSLFDLGFLGQVGAVPGWPGQEVYPAQPMVGQMRAVLSAYAAAGGKYHEEVLPGVGHSPHIEAPDAFLRLLTTFLDGR